MGVLKLSISGFECLNTLLFIAISPFRFLQWMVKYFIVHMHQMNCRDKESVKSNFESNLILGQVNFFSFTGSRQLLNGKDLEGNFSR